MKAEQIRKRFIEFFKEKGHQVVSSSSLIPADPTALFTSAGMQQFVPYLSGKDDPPYKRACSVQKCFRTSDIDEVGDEFHHTFFEMLGNWSFGDYSKKEAINWALELLVDCYHLEKDRLWVTIFKGQAGVPRDEEAKKFWLENGIRKEKIKEFGSEANFWGPVGSTGPCGPCSEIHYDRGKEFQSKKCTLPDCGPNCGCGRFVEIWNLVFMEYDKSETGEFRKLPAQNVDTGAGLERLACILQDKESDYETELFLPIIKKIREIAQDDENEILNSNNYVIPPSINIPKRNHRIIADHIRGACFLIADGVLPNKEDRGYVLRRILRRAMCYGKLSKCPENFLISIIQTVIDNYCETYPELKSKQNDILTVIQNEGKNFSKALDKGLKEVDKLKMIGGVAREKPGINPPTLNRVDALKVFYIIQTYGVPLEIIKEELAKKLLLVDEEELQKEIRKHQEISRAGVKNKFGGVGEWGEQVAAHHTATHLLHQALRQVLGNYVQQAGSDLTPERLRFDFTHTEKLTGEQIKKTEEIVNQIIDQKLEVKMEEMSYEQAMKSGALAFFKEKYPQTVKVYSVGNFSKEICAGPHVKNTSEIGKFKIIKEQASGAGVRRIKAILEK
ncbi:MAG: alanine--tRNA ligase [Patescibacteria group bacterium]|nr:alanine--tRNA ligase [Patescibacteria group bacterium]MDD5172956.1 alanine--tRNA ligase [Patescibacteria group bacterium]